MTYCRRCGWDPCRFQHAQITKEPPVDEPEDIEVHEIDKTAEPEVVAVIEDEATAEAELVAEGYRRRGVVWITEPELWGLLELDPAKAHLRHMEFDHQRMVFKIYLDSPALPLVPPGAEARSIDWPTTVDLFGLPIIEIDLEEPDE